MAYMDPMGTVIGAGVDLAAVDVHPLADGIRGWCIRVWRDWRSWCNFDVA